MQTQQKGPPAHVVRILESGDAKAIKAMRSRAGKNAAETRRKNSEAEEAAAAVDAAENEGYELFLEAQREKDFLDQIVTEKIVTGEIQIDPEKGDVIPLH